MPGSLLRSAGRFALVVGLTTSGVGCSSKPAEVDTAIVSPDPAVKPAPAPAATPPTPGADGATTPSPSTPSATTVPPKS